MNTLTLVIIALVVGLILGARFGRIVLLLALIGVAAWVLANLPRIVELIGEVRAIATVMGWGW